MNYSRKLYVDAYQYINPEKTPVELFQKISNENTYIDKKGRLQFYCNKYYHIGIPQGYWLVIFPNIPWDELPEQKYKVYNDENFKKLFTLEPEYSPNILKRMQGGPNPIYPDRPYPNNIHAIKVALGLSNMKLGNLCGVSYTTIANFDRGDRPINDTYKNLIEQATEYEVQRYYE